MSGGQAPEDRFPTFRVLAQAPAWDAATRELVLSRVRPPHPPVYLNGHEFATATALVGQLLDLDDELAAHLAASIDHRLTEDETDGWHYDDMPVDHDVWRQVLAGLDDDARQRNGTTFVELPAAEQHALLHALHTSQDERWHDLNRGHTWDLLLRYTCTAYYAHPAAWDEMGWPGPAYPRGYKNIGIDAREPFEQEDRVPSADPTKDRDDE
ncbi:gluconate 2-dehydrogenase subunit 3 family protein [Amnibacterium sp. CER49]|uniref:gluconate 2-dehydrogenase subunit 3 family protein n=1 Tax=Amnibacterium sp. CER49 TaxID=3039161 RepID=UPI00244C27E0|nr:gluconate 2-dehydrogenase subunit 3 family protein [Amnibacterium sp. CER49]MDH2442769.1 gluconate 2-dehydrogenase subunit 3 family protein [Amnibacterium sp. CER49]